MPEAPPPEMASHLWAFVYWLRKMTDEAEFLQHALGFVHAASKYEAVGKVTKLAGVKYPTADGWGPPDVLVGNLTTLHVQDPDA